METAIRKEHFRHPDFTENFKALMCEYLNSLIDAELEKEDADFDFIDECANAINAIREDFEGVILPIISEKEFMRNLNGNRKNSFIKAVIAACAAVAVVLTLNTVVEKTMNVDMIQLASKWVENLFEEKVEPEEIPVTKETEKTTEADIPTPDSIELKFNDSFKREYEVGEKLDLSGLTVEISYSDKKLMLLNETQYEIKVSDNFGTKAGYETVTVKYGSLEESFTVRVINTEKTSLLSSVYAVFPDTFTFTSGDLKNINLDSMQVFAVFSDGTEKELSHTDYELLFEDLSDETEEKVMVTVKYKTVSCSFMVFKE